MEFEELFKVNFIQFKFVIVHQIIFVFITINFISFLLIAAYFSFIVSRSPFAFKPIIIITVIIIKLIIIEVPTISTYLDHILSFINCKDSFKVFNQI